MDDVVAISVVRDFGMYARCITENPNMAGCETVAIDNTAAADGIGVCYNRFLDSFDFSRPAWLVFCHEDFEPLENLRQALDGRDRAALWGPIGALTEVVCGIYHRWRFAGEVWQCRKDGTCRSLQGRKVPDGTFAETFDCQCLAVHSSLVAQAGLRFDENLTFDLYAEDFCMAAAIKGIPSRIMHLKACHWSPGQVQQRYAVQEAYLAAKYPDACFTGTSSWILGGDPPLFRRLTVRAKKLALGMLSRMKTA